MMQLAREAEDKAKVSRTMTPAIICLLGTSRSGSTLLQNVLARHSGAIALGEIARVNELLEKQTDCACGKKLTDCTFWAPALQDLERSGRLVAWSNATWAERLGALRGTCAAMTGLHFLVSRDERNSARHLEKALAALSRETGGSLFIDSSKDPQQFLRLALLPAHRVIPVHVVRDPRGVAWSAFRRTGIDPITMAKHWGRLNRAIAALGQLTSAHPWQLVRYEDFCRDPQRVSTGLLEAVGTGTKFDHTGVAHALGGSTGFSFQDGDAVVADERWKAEMPGAMRRYIMKATGGTARKFGYA
jgi:hypothetical protein